MCEPGTEPSAAAILKEQVEQTANQMRGLFRRASQVAADDAAKLVAAAKDTKVAAAASGALDDDAEPPPVVPGQSEEDTMKNLRKTFAGIFGDM